MYPQVFGKYVLERELSRGGMARVVLATLRGAGGFEKKLVVKQIRDELAFDQQFVRRFVEEAKTTVALSHPNIVPVYELGVEQGTYFLAMELVEGVSVAELLRDRDRDGSRRVLTPEEGAYLGVEVCRALDYAHRRMKVVHRDITPRNVMIDEEGQIKLIDFGIAAPALVSGHEILGSPGHMAPEQVDGGELGPATDIFAVAVLLMEAWTGAAPFRRATPEECALAMREAHPKPSDFDPRLVPLDAEITRAMKLDPRKRQQDADELGRALRVFLQGVDVADIARSLGERVRELREHAELPSPSSRAHPRPSLASHGELGTKTFAARDEALRWSSPPSGEAKDDAAAPSTRKLEEGSGRGRRDDPAMSIPTPLMVDVDELERIHGEIAARANRSDPPKEAASIIRRRAPADEPGDERVETIATRPLETPVRALDKTTVVAPPGRGARLYAVLGLVALVGVGTVAVWRARGTVSVEPTRSPPTSMSAPSDPPPPVATATESPRSVGTVTDPLPVATPSSVASAAPPSAASAGMTATSPSSAAPIGAGKAAVTFLGEPGTRVSIDGSMRGPCPVRVTLSEGPHDVRFMFEPTGESRGERFTVKSGDHVTVRAEFTGVTPTIKFQR